jgi:hypothetical protein
VVGLVLAADGSQKLFGAFGGAGLRGAAGHFAKLRYRAPLAPVGDEEVARRAA